MICGGTPTVLWLVVALGHRRAAMALPLLLVGGAGRQSRSSIRHCNGLPALFWTIALYAAVTMVPHLAAGRRWRVDADPVRQLWHLRRRLSSSTRYLAAANAGHWDRFAACTYRPVARPPAAWLAAGPNRGRGFFGCDQGRVNQSGADARSRSASPASAMLPPSFVDYALRWRRGNPGLPDAARGCEFRLQDRSGRGTPGGNREPHLRRGVAGGRNVWAERRSEEGRGTHRRAIVQANQAGGGNQGARNEQQQSTGARAIVGQIVLVWPFIAFIGVSFRWPSYPHGPRSGAHQTLEFQPPRQTGIRLSSNERRRARQPATEHAGAGALPTRTSPVTVELTSTAHWPIATWPAKWSRATVPHLSITVSRYRLAAPTAGPARPTMPVPGFAICTRCHVVIIAWPRFWSSTLIPRKAVLPCNEYDAPAAQRRRRATTVVAPYHRDRYAHSCCRYWVPPRWHARGCGSACWRSADRGCFRLLLCCRARRW